MKSWVCCAETIKRGVKRRMTERLVTLKNCPICKQKFSFKKNSTCYRTCSRPCSIVWKAQQRVKTARINLQVARERLYKLQELYALGALPTDRGKALRGEKTK